MNIKRILLKIMGFMNFGLFFKDLSSFFVWGFFLRVFRMIEELIKYFFIEFYF